MDEQDIYASVEEPSGPHVKWERVKSSENINQNEDTCCSLETDRTGTTLSAFEESSTVRSCSYRASTVILGLLCLLFLVGLITVFVLYNGSSSKWETKMIQLHTSYNDLTKEKDQLQISYNNLTEEKDQLQTSYNNLTKEKDQLQISYNNLTEEKDQLQTSYNNLTKEKDQLQKQVQDIHTELQKKLQALHSQGWKNFSGSFYYISSTTKSWQESRNDCLQKKSDLVIIKSPEEQEFIRSWKKRTWIGLTDAETEGTWTWVDGTLLGSPRFWAQSEPNNSGNEDCGEILIFGSQNGWNDVTCDSKNYWICEIELNDYFRLATQ